MCEIAGILGPFLGQCHPDGQYLGLEFGEGSRWRGQLDSNQVLPRPGETPEVHAGGRDRKGSQAGWVFKETGSGVVVRPGMWSDSPVGVFGDLEVRFEGPW